MGRVDFPEEYPKYAPNIKMITENGRFAKNGQICMSVTGFHGDEWNSIWKATSIIQGLVSMYSEGESENINWINRSKAQIKSVAKNSREEVKKHAIYKKYFAQYDQVTKIQEKLPGVKVASKPSNIRSKSHINVVSRAARPGIAARKQRLALKAPSAIKISKQVN